MPDYSQSMNPVAIEAVEATVQHLRDKYGGEGNRLEILESLRYSYMLMRHDPALYLTEPGLLPDLIVAVTLLIAFEQDKQAGRMN